MDAIRTEAELREVIGSPFPGLEEKNQPKLNEFARDYIARSPFLVLSTADAEGRLDSSPKGDAPGFVVVEDDKHLLIPDRPGNKLAYGHQNILATGRVGIIFMIPGTNETLRINGKAELTASPDLLENLAARGKPAVLAIRVEVDEVFFHCAKAFIRARLWNQEAWGEKHKVSFGKMVAAARNLPESVAETIDADIEQDYKQNL